jgi:hypothetical protein
MAQQTPTISQLTPTISQLTGEEKYQPVDNKQLHTIRRSFSKFQMAQQTPTISQLTRH